MSADCDDIDRYILLDSLPGPVGGLGGQAFAQGERQTKAIAKRYEAAIASGLTDVTDNRALDVACYEPG